jgi:hypothetical protein
VQTNIAGSVSGAWVQISKHALASAGNFFLSLGTSGDAVDIYAATASAVTYETAPRAADQVITTSAAYYGPRFNFTYNGSAWTQSGLLIEETRANVALYSRDLTNAAWSKTNITAALNMTGIDGVANSASRITASAANGTVLQSITLASSQRFQSSYLQRITGTGSVYMTMDGGTTWTDVTSQVGSSGTWIRASIPAQTVTNPSVGFKLATSGDAIGVDFVQNEGGAFATSVIYTTSASVTRAPDVVQLTGVAASAFVNTTAAVVVETQIPYPASRNIPVISAGTGTYGIFWNNSVRAAMYDQAASHQLNTSSSLTLSNVQRIAATWSASGRSIANSGSAVSTDAFINNYSGTVNLGESDNLGTIDGYIRSLAIYNQRLPDAKLQRISNVGASFIAANDNGVLFAFANDNLPVQWRIAL